MLFRAWYSCAEKQKDIKVVNTFSSSVAIVAILAILALFLYFVLALIVHRGMSQTNPRKPIPAYSQPSNGRFILVEVGNFLVNFFRIIPIGSKNLIARRKGENLESWDESSHIK